eukprot:13984445-Ditylum_brightwellii.AAC.1
MAVILERSNFIVMQAKACIPSNTLDIDRNDGENGEEQEVPTSCDKFNPLLEGPLMNEDTEEMKVGEWNNIRHTVVITPDMADMTDAWIYVTSVDAGRIYELDDVQMIPAAYYDE